MGSSVSCPPTTSSSNGTTIHNQIGRRQISDRQRGATNFHPILTQQNNPSPTQTHLRRSQIPQPPKGAQISSVNQLPSGHLNFNQFKQTTTSNPLQSNQTNIFSNVEYFMSQTPTSQSSNSTSNQLPNQVSSLSSNQVSNDVPPPLPPKQKQKLKIQQPNQIQQPNHGVGLGNIHKPLERSNANSIDDGSNAGQDCCEQRDSDGSQPPTPPIRLRTAKLASNQQQQQQQQSDELGSPGCSVPVIVSVAPSDHGEANDSRQNQAQSSVISSSSSSSMSSTSSSSSSEENIQANESEEETEGNEGNEVPPSFVSGTRAQDDENVIRINNNLNNQSSESETTLSGSPIPDDDETRNQIETDSSSTSNEEDQVQK